MCSQQQNAVEDARTSLVAALSAGFLLRVGTTHGAGRETGPATTELPGSPLGSGAGAVCDVAGFSRKPFPKHSAASPAAEGTSQPGQVPAGAGAPSPQPAARRQLGAGPKAAQPTLPPNTETNPVTVDFFQHQVGIVHISILTSIHFSVQIMHALFGKVETREKKNRREKEKEYVISSEIRGVNTELL